MPPADVAEAHLPDLAGLGRAPAEARRQVIEEALQLVGGHGAGKLEALDPRLRQPLTPLPSGEVMKLVRPQQHFAGKEGELRPRTRLLELTQPLHRAGDRAPGGGMVVPVETERAERLGEGGEEPGRRHALLAGAVACDRIRPRSPDRARLRNATRTARHRASANRRKARSSRRGGVRPRALNARARTSWSRSRSLAS